MLILKKWTFNFRRILETKDSLPELADRACAHRFFKKKKNKLLEFPWTRNGQVSCHSKVTIFVCNLIFVVQRVISVFITIRRASEIPLESSFPLVIYLAPVFRRWDITKYVSLTCVGLHYLPREVARFIVACSQALSLWNGANIWGTRKWLRSVNEESFG